MNSRMRCRKIKTRKTSSPVSLHAFWAWISVGHLYFHCHYYLKFSSCIMLCIIQTLEEEMKSAFYLKTQSVPRCKHSVSVIQTRQLMLYREIIAVCSEIHTKHINTAVWGRT